METRCSRHHAVGQSVDLPGNRANSVHVLPLLSWSPVPLPCTGVAWFQQTGNIPVCLWMGSSQAAKLLPLLSKIWKFLGIFTPHPRGKCLSTDWWGWDRNNATSSPLVRTLLQGDFYQCTPSSQSANFLPSRTRWVCGRTETYTWPPSQGNSSVKEMSAEINSGLHYLAAIILPHHGPGTLGSQTAELYRPALNSTDFYCLQSDLHERASVTFVDMPLSCSLAWPPSFLFSFYFLETLISDLSMTLSVSICF